ncbi:MAG: hypothetical protein M1830_008496 [Pleopsidium flavum]|nr:MAG: hypothetical protein M1830_008496 [Pleopsidium flavum]
MAEPEIQIIGHASAEDLTGDDVEMVGAEITEVIEVVDADAADGEGAENDAVEEEEEEEKTTPRVTFVDYLKSPVIELLIGTKEDQTLLTAHQALLVQSPFFAEAVAQFSEDATTRRIELPDEQLDAVGCFLQYLYTGEYFPKRLDESKGGAQGGLEHDPSAPNIDDTGDQLLKHARVYALAHKLGITDLKTLAHSKVHRINSTARGEIAYARFVYAHTPREDTTIRRPVASFWAQRSHVLRHEADDEFKRMCLEFPQFGFDVLSLVLDAKEKKEGERERVEAPKSARKRARLSER